MSVFAGVDGLAVVEELCLKPGERHPGPCKGWRKNTVRVVPRAKARKLGALFGEQRPLTQEERRELVKAYTGTFGGLTARLSKAGRTPDGKFKVLGNIYPPGADPRDPQAPLAGDFERTLWEGDDGQLRAEHKFLALDKQFQGQGFATGFNAKAMAQYREWGVARVQLFADIDVGGIAWARQGYDWEAKEDSIAIERRILETLDMMNEGRAPRPPEDLDSDGFEPMWDRIPAHLRAAQVQAAWQMRRRLMLEEFGSDDYPTPFEISELGRWPGASFTGAPDGTGDWWIGRVIMTGSAWNGVTVP